MRPEQDPGKPLDRHLPWQITVGPLKNRETGRIETLLGTRVQPNGIYRVGSCLYSLNYLQRFFTVHFIEDKK